LLRVRVPDELRPIVGKLEVRRSTKTSDPDEAKRRVRIERLKTEAEFDDARRRRIRSERPSSTSAVDQTDEQVWVLATRWFSQNEKQRSDKPDVWDGDLET